MPRITADGPDDPSLDVIRTIDITDKDIIEMSDEQLEAHIRMLRGNREAVPERKPKLPKAAKASKADGPVAGEDDFV